MNEFLLMHLTTVKATLGPGKLRLCCALRRAMKLSPMTLTLTLNDANWVELRHCQKRMYSINIYSAEARFGDGYWGATLRDVRYPNRCEYFFFFFALSFFFVSSALWHSFPPVPSSPPLYNELLITINDDSMKLQAEEGEEPRRREREVGEGGGKSRAPKPEKLVFQLISRSHSGTMAFVLCVFSTCGNY